MAIGGRIGGRNVPGVDGYSGIWTPNEIADAQRAGVWNDPYAANIVAGLHMNGANGSTTFTDIKGHTFTANGNAQISTAQSRFGGSSGLFDGTGDYLSAAASADFGFGAGAWTISAWVRPSVVTGDISLFDSRVSSAVGVGIYTSLTAQSNKWGLANNSAIVASGGNLVANEWEYLEIVRSGNTVMGFRWGVLEWTYTDTRTYASSAAINIGANSSGGTGFNGYINDFLITKGVARHTAKFVVPVATFAGF